MKGGIIGLSGGVLAILALSSAQAAEPTVHPDRNNIAALLDAPAQWEFVDTPFHDIIKYLKVHDKIVVQIDNKAIGDRLSVEMEITFNVKLIPLKSALHILLGDLGLAYIVDGDALLITTAEAAAKQRSAVTYPINDILKLQGQSRKSPNSSAACKALIKAITATIDPQSWTPADPAQQGLLKPEQRGKAVPPTSIVAIPGGSPNSLVVKHNADVHDQITELLACLRRVRPGDAAQRAGIARDMTPAETRIDDALATRVDLDFNDTPFDKVVGQLKKRFKIEILGDPATLKDGSSIGGEDITRKFRNEPLRSALRKMLGDLRLTFIIRDEVVLITTPEIAASQLSTKVYPLPPDTKPEVVDSLLKEIRGLIAPNSCDGVAVVDLSVPVLIARQTPKIHEAIVKRLARSEFHDAKSK